MKDLESYMLGCLLKGDTGATLTYTRILSFGFRAGGDSNGKEMRNDWTHGDWNLEIEKF